MRGWTFIACARHRSTASGSQRILLSWRNMKTKYMISCWSMSWVGRIGWQSMVNELSRSNRLTVKIRTPLCNWHIAFFFDSRPLVIFSLLSTCANLRSSERLKQVSTNHENTPLSDWGWQLEPADYSRSAVLYSSEVFPKSVHILGMLVMYRLICMVCGREGPGVEFKVCQISQ